MADQTDKHFAIRELVDDTPPDSGRAGIDKLAEDVSAMIDVGWNLVSVHPLAVGKWRFFFTK